MAKNKQQLNITCRTDVVLHDRLIFDGETFDPNLSVGIVANLVTSMGKRNPLGVEVDGDELVISIPWVEGRNPGCYGLEVTGTCNSKKWATYADSLIRYTQATKHGASEVTVESDYYDITMEVGYRYGEGGNVNDVLVNGESVVQAGKARITMPTKVSDLENDADYATQEDVEESKISEVEATIDDNVGTPEVEATLTGHKLTLAFQNLLGDGIASIEQTTTSEESGGVNVVRVTTVKGKVGVFEIRNGERGDTVILGEGVEYTLYNGTGKNTDGAMTQYATTKAISEVIYDISAANNGETYASLSEALGTNGANIPLTAQKGGISVRFVQSPDNKYVQYFLTKNEWSVSEADWQKMNLEEEVSQLSQKVDENAIYSSETVEVDIATNATLNKYIKTGISDGATVDMTPVDTQSFQYVTYPVTAGEQIRIKGGGGGNPRLWAFVDGDNKLLSKADADTHQTTYLTLTAPADGMLICDALMDNNTYPFSVLVSNEETVTIEEAVSDLYEKTETIEEEVTDITNEITNNEYEKEVLASINSLRIGLTPRTDFSGYDEDGRWAFVGNSAYSYRLLVMKSGEEISIKAGSHGSQYAFIADLVKPVNLAPIGYVEGTSRITIPSNTRRTVTVPEDCYMYILMKYNNNSGYAPLSLTINGIEQLTTIVGNSSELPKGVLVYSASNSRFTFYGKREGTSQYFSFRIQHKIDHSELEYADLWHLTKGHLCNYTNGVFTDVCETIDDAENEMAMKFSGKADFTGGYHGDERIDIDASSYVRFFADGKLISDLTADFEMECTSFSFVQYSTLHETTNDGTTPIPEHPIVAYHFKRTTFENGRFSVENSVKMASAQTVTTAFAGLFCTGKDVASVAIIPFAQEIQMDGDNSQHSANNKQDATVIFYDSTNSVECVTEGHFLQGYEDTTDVNYFLVWDRSVDSKYYRGNSLSKSFNNGDIIRNEFTAVFK